MAQIGRVHDNQRVDVRIVPEIDGATVMFLYSGVVDFEMRSGDDQTVTDQLQFDPSDSDLDESQIVGPMGLTITPTSFNGVKFNGAFSVIDINKTKVFFRPEGRGLRVSAEISVQNAAIFRVAYQMTVKTNV